MQKNLSTYQNLLTTGLNSDEKLAVINTELQKLMIHFNKKADRGKRNFQLYKYTSILLAAITTVVSSLQVIYASQFPPWILPIASAGATVAVAFLGASSAQKIWIDSKTTQQRLQTEQLLFNQQADRYHNLLTEDRIRLFSERMINIWNEGHGKWEQIVGND